MIIPAPVETEGMRPQTSNAFPFPFLVRFKNEPSSYTSLLVPASHIVIAQNRRMFNLPEVFTSGSTGEGSDDDSLQERLQSELLNTHRHVADLASRTIKNGVWECWSESRSSDHLWYLERVEAWFGRESFHGASFQKGDLVEKNRLWSQRAQSSHGHHHRHQEAQRTDKPSRRWSCATSRPKTRAKRSIHDMDKEDSKFLWWVCLVLIIPVSSSVCRQVTNIAIRKSVHFRKMFEIGGV